MLVRSDLGAGNARVLPPLLDGNGFTPWQRVVNLTDIMLVLVAFALLSAHPRRSLLNLWLMVVMGYWFCDITLSSYLNGAVMIWVFTRDGFMADWRRVSCLPCWCWKIRGFIAVSPSPQAA
jgi:hypothetical protein